MEVVVHHDPNRRGKIQTPHPAPNRYLVAGILIANLCRKAEGFAPKKQVVPMIHICLCVLFLSVSAKGRQARRAIHGPALQKGFIVDVVSDIDLTPVIQPRPFEVLVIHPESKRVNQVQPDLRRPA